MRGSRKLIVVGGVLAALVGGLFATRDPGMYAAFATAVVGAGGWFFKANIDEHKAKGAS